ncbi:efflux RND transporter permease subunit [Halorarius litoreus]|uniref:efflux RND transporter permease subunit n=1 Tax=Halorarius litoreus TaxID=2962676 RepID=UPI0020CBB609|nr:MMPL family transporter [Halorarius litoreus]
MRRIEQLAAATVTRRRAVIVLVLLATVGLGVAAPAVELSTSLDQFRGGTPEARADGFIETQMSGSEPNVTQGFIVVRGQDDVLTKQQYLQHLEVQRALLANETVNRTLEPDQRPLSIANVVAIIAIRAEQGVDAENVSIEPRPSLDAQEQALRNMTEYRSKLYTSYAVGIVLDDYEHTWPPGGGFAFVPTTYEANQKTAAATGIVVSHEDETDPKNLTAAQVAMVDIANDELERTEAIGVGNGLINDELRRSSIDSLVIVGPVAFLAMLVVLSFAYRDPLDVVLGLLGVGMVLVWTFGYMGWMGITFNQLFVAVPVLLMGLSIDYAIHVFMRHREERGEGVVDPTTREETGGFQFGDGGDGAVPVKPSMRVALSGVGVALALVTLTTATGFLSNLVSGVGPIREFGVVSAVGIVAAFVVFGGFIPALKVELDAALEARGYDRNKPAFGTEGGRLTKALAAPVAAARVAPWGVVVLVGLITLAALGGAATVDTSFEQDDLLVEETPEWTGGLPQAMQPSNYTVQDNLDYVRESNFIYDGTTTEILVRGDVTDDDALERVARTMDRANETEVALVLPNTNPGTRSVLTMMWAVAVDNETFNRTLARADTDGNRVPDRNLEQVYDAFYDAAPRGAPTMLHRSGDEYTALRVTVPINGTYGEATITTQIRNATAPVQGEGLRTVATGQPIMNQAVASQLLDTVSRSLVVTLLVVLAMLMVAYRRTVGSASLGAVTLAPILLAVTWIVGTMALLEIPFNVMTAVITSFTIGIGVDYSIHVAERYASELERLGDPDEALRVAVLGTGGALLGSAVTDIAGVGVLVFAILVPLQQFGVITALTIAYSLVASVFVLPSLLLLWTERFAPPALQPASSGSPADD